MEYITELESTSQFQSPGLHHKPSANFTLSFHRIYLSTAIQHHVKNIWACSKTANLYNANNLTLALALGNFMSVLLKRTCVIFKNRLYKYQTSFLLCRCENSLVLRLLLEHNKNHLSYVHVWFNYWFFCTTLPGQHPASHYLKALWNKRHTSSSSISV